MPHPRPFGSLWAKTFGLWLLLVIGLAVVGGYLGAWVTPTILAIARDGWSGLPTIPVWNHTPQIPNWAGEPQSVPRRLVMVGYLIPIVGMMATLGTVGERVYQHVVVRLGWLTEEQVDEARRNEKQYF